MTQPDLIAFWTILSLGPIPFWHFALHLCLPLWRKQPAAFYAFSALLWLAFWPLADVLAHLSPSHFDPPLWAKAACLGVACVAAVLIGWAIHSLTPKRFFLVAALYPDRIKPELVLQGPYRFLRHPAYTSILVVVAASFVASGERILFAFLLEMALLLPVVAALELRELNARLKGMLSR